MTDDRDRLAMGLQREVDAWRARAEAAEARITAIEALCSREIETPAVPPNHTRLDFALAVRAALTVEEPTPRCAMCNDTGMKRLERCPNPIHAVEEPTPDLLEALADSVASSPGGGPATRSHARRDSGRTSAAQPRAFPGPGHPHTRRERAMSDLLSLTHHTFDVRPWPAAPAGSVLVTQADDDESVVLILKPDDVAKLIDALRAAAAPQETEQPAPTETDPT